MYNWEASFQKFSFSKWISLLVLWCHWVYNVLLILDCMLYENRNPSFHWYLWSGPYLTSVLTFSRSVLSISLLLKLLFHLYISILDNHNLCCKLSAQTAFVIPKTIKCSIHCTSILYSAEISYSAQLSPLCTVISLCA